MQTNDLDAAVQLFAEVLQVRVEQYGGGWVGVAGEGALLLPRLAAAGSGSCGAGCMPQSLLSLRFTLYSCRYLAYPRLKPLCLQTWPRSAPLPTSATAPACCTRPKTRATCLGPA